MRISALSNNPYSNQKTNNKSNVSFCMNVDGVRTYLNESLEFAKKTLEESRTTNNSFGVDYKGISERIAKINKVITLVQTKFKEFETREDGLVADIKLTHEVVVTVTHDKTKAPWTKSFFGAWTNVFEEIAPKIVEALDRVTPETLQEISKRNADKDLTAEILEAGIKDIGVI